MLNSLGFHHVAKKWNISTNANTYLVLLGFHEFSEQNDINLSSLDTRL